MPAQPLHRRGARVRARSKPSVDDASLPAPLLHAPTPLDLLLEDSSPGRLFRRTTTEPGRDDRPDDLPFPEPGRPARADGRPLGRDSRRTGPSVPGGSASGGSASGGSASGLSVFGLFDAEVIGTPAAGEPLWTTPGDTPYGESDLAALARAVRAPDAPSADELEAAHSSGEPDGPDEAESPAGPDEDDPFAALGRPRPPAKAYFAPDAGADSIHGDEPSDAVADVPADVPADEPSPGTDGADDGPADDEPTELWAAPDTDGRPLRAPGADLHIDLSDGPRLITRPRDGSGDRPLVPAPRAAGPDEDTETIGDPVDLIEDADLTTGRQAQPREADDVPPAAIRWAAPEPGPPAPPTDFDAVLGADPALLIPGLAPREQRTSFVTPPAPGKGRAPKPSTPRTPGAGPEPRPGGAPSDSIAMPRLPEPTVAVTLAAVAAIGVGSSGAPAAAWLPVVGLALVAPLSVMTPEQPRLRVLRAGLMLAAAAALPLLHEPTGAIAVLIAVAAAGTYPIGLAERQSRIVLAMAGAALAVPLLAGIAIEGFGPVVDSLTAPAGAPLDATLLGRVRVVQLCGVLVVLLVGMTAVSVRRALATTAELAVRREAEAAEAAARIGRASTTDAESGLPNRDALLRATTAALEARTAHDLEPSRDQVAVLIVEVDRFDVIADSLGAALADDVALQVARRLRSGLPAQQLVARLARHRFGLLLPHATPDSCAGVARRITRLMERPVVAGARDYSVTCSVGAALRGPGLRDAHDLLQAADEATRAATAAGTARWVLFDQAVRAAAHSRASLEIELRDVVRTGAVEVYFQPLVALGRAGDDGEGDGEDRIVGAEALARWIRSDGSSVPPTTFIPMADELGIGGELGLQIADLALDALVDWRRSGLQVDQVWVNVSPAQLRDPDLAHDLAARLATRGLPPSSLVVEVSAAHLVEAEQTQTTLSMLRSLGIAVALDDFGRSGTSLSALRKLPVSAVKLDHVLAAELGRGESGDAVPRSIAQLCRSLGLRVIVEGVETMMQLRGARDIEADAVQGFAIARPLPSEDIVSLLLKRPALRRTTPEQSRSGSTAR
ncbi:EAL domain-containing protein [Spongisporangium articulatum]|uniref:EAL domain-containing protein n=1 Tax=Spongisporangium articulatum TaxID=3362603 RepID=A0ABW8ANR0_9ACTN